MAEIEGMLAGIESPNKRAKMDSGQSSTNFDESKFARYYRTDTVTTANASQSATVGVNDAAAYHFSLPYTYTSANSLSTYSASTTQHQSSPVFTYSSSYGYDFSTINGIHSEYQNGSGTQLCRYACSIKLLHQLSTYALHMRCGNTLLNYCI